MENVVLKPDGKMVFIPREYFEKHRSHRNKDKWIRLWFYKDRQRLPVTKSQVKYDYDVTSKLEYHLGTFYKLSQLSAEDDTFDYYFKLKSGLPKDVFKKNNRYKSPSSMRRTQANRWKENPVPKTFVVNNEGKFLVSFE